MLILDKTNICEYLLTHYPALDQSNGLAVREVGDPTQELQEDEAGGFINHLFRVANDTTSIIVKQGQENMRINERKKIPAERNRLEYETLQIRRAITPEYIPIPYYHDPENAVFLMEDVSYLGSVRYQLCHGQILPNLATQLGTFFAANAFYTSELYMDTDKFRRLSAHFRNSEMRDILESWVFLRNIGDEESEALLDEHSVQLMELVEHNQAVRARTHEMRHKFMSHTECFVHGDLHVSNMFANRDTLKIIDMEYTFAGPYSYDVGYNINSMLGEYASACFRSFPNAQARTDYISYLLNNICTIYNTFVCKFSEHWEQDAKEVYRGEKSYLQSLVDGFLPDVLGYAAIPTLCQHHYRVTATFTILPQEAKRKAQELCTLLSQHWILNVSDDWTVGGAVAGVVNMTRLYCAGLEQ